MITTETIQRYTLVALAALGLGACANASQYVRSTAPAGEIVWKFDGGFQATKGGEVVTSESDGWEGLDAAVACVPDSAALAEQVKADARKASILGWSGAGTLLGSLAAGIAMTVAGARSESGELVGGGIGVMFGGLIGGSTLALLSVRPASRVRAQAVDAINIYNDRHAATPGCTAPAGRRAQARSK
jgi:hypothetical protein